MRSIPFLQRLGHNFSRVEGGHLGKVILKSGSRETPGQLFSLGVPKTRNILKI